MKLRSDGDRVSRVENLLPQAVLSALLVTHLERSSKTQVWAGCLSRGVSPQQVHLGQESGELQLLFARSASDLFDLVDTKPRLHPQGNQSR